MCAKLLAALASAAVTFAAASAPNNQARVTAAQGQVSVDRDQTAWAITSGEQVRAKKVLVTGPDGFARLEADGGVYFEIYANSKVRYRSNSGDSGDVVDVFGGRAKIHLAPDLTGHQQRVFTPVATIAASTPATIAIAIDGDDHMRLDVIEGEVRVQHRLLPNRDATLVKAVDAILIEPDQKISRRLDRDAAYRYALKLRDIVNVLSPGHAGPKPGQPVEQGPLLAKR